MDGIDEPSAEARNLLARYREQRPGAGARARNWDGVQRRIAARKQPQRSSLRRQLAWGFAAAAAAALVLLVADRLLPRPDVAGIERDAGPGSQAVDGEASEPVPSQAPVRAPATARTPSAEATTSVPSITPTPIESPRAPTLRDRSREAIPPSAQSSATSETLAEETKLVAQIRSAIARDDLDAARATLDEHHRRFPNGALEEDREAYATIVQCRSGEPDAAAKRRAFLQRYPRSPHRPRIDEACR